jgi:hypothetical protein
MTIPFGVGLVLLRRESETLNAGVFLGLGLVNALGVVSMLISGPDVFTCWASALVICLRHAPSSLRIPTRCRTVSQRVRLRYLAG